MSLPYVKTEEEMPKVPLSQLRKMVDKTSLLPDDTLLSLELILTAFFPTVWKNIEQYSNDCYTNGYLQGLSERNEN